MGLVQYDSSDEDEEIQPPPQTTTAQPEPSTSVSEPDPSTSTQAAPPGSTEPEPKPPAATSHSPTPGPRPVATTQPGPSPAPGPAAASTTLRPEPLGPARPPPSATTTNPLPEPDEEAAAAEQPDLAFLSTAEPTNPQSRAALLRDLTLPAVPNLDIPPSPPSSPRTAAAVDALTTKVQNLLRVKRTRGVHFNGRLIESKGMRDPGLPDRLMKFVGVETEFSSSSSEAGNEKDGGGGEDEGNDVAIAQYETVLPPAIYNPYGFPAWAYRPALRKAQDKAQKERERGKGEKVEFVSAGSSTFGTPAVAGAGSRDVSVRSGAGR
ncbi:hypothetical protein VTJ04DRAFT_6026 [Mycothermus thermophilus]|uniref:uncharacterized protein n=1 Tax=Humicola insolens TaxID=85995 RepID=UPI003742E9D9